MAEVVLVRPDRRPEAYDIAPTEKVGCYECMNNGKVVGFPYKHVFIMHGYYSPYGDEQTHYYCEEHIKKHFPNVVIVDPSQGFLCRDLSGKEWRELE